MTDGHRQGVGGIGAGVAGQPQKNFYHVLNLSFFGIAITGHRLFDCPRTIVKNRQAILHNRHHCRATGMTQLEGRAGIGSEKDILDRRYHRAMKLNHLIDTLENLIETVGEGMLRTGFDSPAGDKIQVTGTEINHPIASYPRAWVYAQDPFHSSRPADPAGRADHKAWAGQRSRPKSGDPLNQIVIDIEIGGDILHVIVVFEIVEQFDQRPGDGFFGDLHGVFGDHRHR